MLFLFILGGARVALGTAAAVIGAVTAAFAWAPPPRLSARSRPFALSTAAAVIGASRPLYGHRRGYRRGRAAFIGHRRRSYRRSGGPFPGHHRPVIGRSRTVWAPPQLSVHSRPSPGLPVSPPPVGRRRRQGSLAKMSMRDEPFMVVGANIF